MGKQSARSCRVCLSSHVYEYFHLYYTKGGDRGTEERERMEAHAGIVVSVGKGRTS